jgi:transcriptional regulator with XRE-family HTH domain
MSTKQSAIAKRGLCPIARLEAGEQNITLKTLNRIAQATNTRLYISFLPQD